MRRLASVLALFVAASLAWAGDAKQHPLTLKVLRTDSVTFTDTTQTTRTNCTSTPGSDDADCTSHTSGGGTYTRPVSIVEASDGNTYSIQCDPSSAKALIPWAGAIYAAKHNLSAAGCVVPPGTYKARWDKGRIKMLRDDNGKPQETTFTVLSSKPTVRAETTQPAAAISPASSTLLKLSSSPNGAGIELDGNFIGQTPSSVPAADGDHSIKITKAGYRPWERRIKTAGGEITIAAELESESK